MSPIPMPSEDRSRRPRPTPRARSRAAAPGSAAAAEREPCVPLADLVKLAALPAWWTGQPPAAVAESLRDLLAGTLAADAVRVEVRDPTTREPAVAAAGALPAEPAVGTLAGAGPAMRLARCPLGAEARMGSITVGSRRPDFPTQTEQLLLWMAASQVTIALQRAALVAVRRQAAELVAHTAGVRMAVQSAGRRSAELLAAVAGGMRAPLDAMAACAERLQEDAHRPLAERHRAELGRIRASERELLGIAGDLLLLAALEGGGVSLAPADLPVDETLAVLVETVRPQMEARRLRCEHAGSGAGDLVRADPECLRRVLLELLSAAAAGTAPGECVRLDCAVGDDAVEVRVRGDGTGRVPRPADAGDAPAAPSAEVGGIGRALSHGLARAMGGEVRV
ncbi:MAG TPA: hypothetical protein VGO40_21570, partial [Longimicrobium sp.]|nr:hypothetical protein [Longimicrobium sp.]